MAEHSIPVDLYNPGQVFACLGFLEAADVLLGDVEGGFDWRDEANPTFALRASEDTNPFEAVLQFLAQAEVVDVEPTTWPAERFPQSVVREEFPAPLENYWNKQEKKWTRTALPVELVNGTVRVSLAHWGDGSSRNPFKLYSGNRSACSIATAMISGTRAKPKKGKTSGTSKRRGLRSSGRIGATRWSKTHSSELRWAEVSISIPAGRGPRSMRAIHRTSTIIRLPPHPWSSSWPHGVLKTAGPTNSTRARCVTQHGASRFRRCWRGLHFVAPSPPCPSSTFVSSSTCQVRTRS